MIHEILKKIIFSNKTIGNIVFAIYHDIPHKIRISILTKYTLRHLDRNQTKIFYLGIPAHKNLGDLAQGVCIRNWLKKYYPQIPVIEIETDALVNTHLSVLNDLVKVYGVNDFIIFQSGYTTTDLGGHADEMHRAVMKALPLAKMLMMPQTIYFQNDENRRRTSECYNQMKNMLFLARDRISYAMAQEMFPDIKIKLFPDIVTSLIGTLKFEGSREGILFCCRNDSEKYYSDEDISKLMRRCEKIGKVSRTDTTKRGSINRIVKHANQYVNQEIEDYTKYKLMITDRYHGTIFSLVAGTPVIIIKTTDHKVTTGAEWFKGIYDNYVYLAETLEEAYLLAEKIYNKPLSNSLLPYFAEKYYDNLPQIFDFCVAASQTK